MKKTILFLIFLGIFIVLGVGFYFSKGQNNPPPNKDLKGIILFYGIGCPHCAKVEEFIKENRIKEKITFEEREVYFNKENRNLLGEAAKSCRISENEIGVPFLWDKENGKCIIGDEPIIDFFKEKLK
jgi:glutaredoxin